MSEKPTYEPRQKPGQITKFQGIINTVHPYHMPQGALVQADNVLVDKTGGVERRPGYHKVVTGTNVTASYTTLDQKTMFLVDSGVLYAFDGSTAQALITGLTEAPVHWCEESGEKVFMVGGGTSAIIDSRHEVTLMPNINYPLGAIAFHAAQFTLAIWQDSQTCVVMSDPYDFTKFDNAEASFIVPDHIVGMQDVGGSLVLAGANALWVFTPDEILIRLTDYGSVPGRPIAVSGGVAYIWTVRGLCRFPEFANLTQDKVSVPPGSSASVNELSYNGSDYIVVMNDGEGESHNAMFEI